MLSHKLRRFRASAAQATDANFKQVALLLHGDGTNGAQNNTFLDSSTNNFTITRNGTATQGTYTPFSQAAGYWSNNFPTASYLTVATNAAFTYGTGDFTIECWVYLTTTGSIQYIIDQRNSGTANAVIPAIYVSASNVLTYFVSNAAQITGTTALVVGTWYHVAVARSSTSTKMFLNGVQEGSTYSDSNNYVASRVTINSNGATAGNYLVGYTSNVRLVKGTAVYTANFTPSTTPLTAITNTSLLTCQSNWFVDNSSNNFTITPTGTPSAQPWSPFAPTSAYSTSVNGGSMYFAGGSDELQVPQSTSLDFGSSNFTVEAWVYINGSQTGSIQNIFNKRVSNGVFLGLTFTGGNYYTWIWIDGTSVVPTNNGTPVPKNQWVHLAYVRSANNFRTYINGVLNQNVTLSITASTQNGVSRVGNDARFSQAFGGYISNLRVVIGSVVYASAFTPPTAPLTAITNTQLLLSGTNAGIFDNAIENNLVTVGTAQVSTSIVKYGTGSMRFNGGSNYLIIPPTPQLTFGTGNFTIEFWLNLTAYSSFGTVFTTTTTFNTANNLYITTDSGGSGLTVSSNIANFITSSSSLSLATWYHVAVVRNGTTLTLYLNGVSVGSATNSTSFISNTAYIGTISTGSFSINGYVDDFRITNGIARYLANFTPPTQAFPNQ